MQHEPASFWSDIKNYEEYLREHPDSYLFARLSDAYLKLNLVDDALHTARLGVEKYPAYVAGQRALALACYAKGLTEESRRALEAVATAMPEDAEIQKILGRLLAASGDIEGAQRVYRVVREFHPDDEECREELRLLEQAPPVAVVAGDGAPVPPHSAEPFPPAEEDVIDLDDADMLLELEEEPQPSAVEAPRTDPLSTVTLAELYVQQGFFSKALEIYRSLADEDPGNREVLDRIAQLEELVAGTAEAAPDSVVKMGVAMPEPTPFPPDVPSRGRADAVIATLEGWLDSIRRIKACR